MIRSKPLLGGLVLALMGVTALLLQHLKSSHHLGEPGIKTRPQAHSTRLELLMPESAPGYNSFILTTNENQLCQLLPEDTSLRIREYISDDKQSGFELTAVLMGSDRTSIHSPYICLTGQGWDIDSHRTAMETIHMDRPQPYDLPVNKMLATKVVRDADGHSATITGIYVYWYVDGSHYTENDKLWQGWWVPRDLLLHGLLERWAYISVFTYCLPADEPATYERMKKFIASTVPEFQLVPKGGGLK
jgi:hypothetical protein